MTRTLLLALLVFIIFFASACGWINAPVASRDFDIQWNLVEPTRSHSHANLFLTDSGLWGFQPADRGSFTPRFNPGDLVALQSQEAKHYFAVVEAESWGYRFQRIDDKPLQSGLDGSLHPIRNEDATQDRHLCVIPAGSSLVQACGTSYLHQRHHLFELAAPQQDTFDRDPQATLRLVSSSRDETQDPSLPFARVALSGSDTLRTWSESVDPARAPRPLLAVLASPRVQTTLQATVVYDPSCFDGAGTSNLVDFVALPSEALHLSSAAHPLEVETFAARLGADALVDCHGGHPRLLVPSLSRPLLKDDSGRFFGPPALGIVPRDLTRLPEDLRTPWIQTAALVAVGDFTTAAFWAETALTNTPYHDELRDLALATLPVLASAGLPELALRHGQARTHRAWNPDNIPDYLDTRIILLGQFNMPEEQQEYINRRQQLAHSLRDQHRIAWYRWASLRLGLGHGQTNYGPAFRSIIEDLEGDDLEDWALAIWLTLAMNGLDLPVVDDPQELRPRYLDAGADSLWDHTLGGSSIGACLATADETCAPGSYGWTSFRGAGPGLERDLLQRLRATPSIDNHQGFSLDELALPLQALDTPGDHTAFWLAISALVPPQDLGDVADRLVTSLREQMRHQPDSVCEVLPQWQARFENAAARVRAPIVERRHRQWLNFLDWWTADGLSALCNSSDEFVAALESRSIGTNPWTQTLLPLLEDRFLAEEFLFDNVENLHRATELARALGDHNTCTIWSLAISIGAARRGLLPLADQHLITATNCMEDDDELRRTRHIVAAYIDFERAGGRNLIRDGSVENALAQMTRKMIDDPAICIGLLPLGFQLEAQLPAAVARLADHIQIAPTPTDDFRLHTASQIVDDGRSAYLTALRDLQRGAWRGAARSLHLARGNFLRLGHLPGLSRIAFLEAVVFDGQIAAYADEDTDSQPLLNRELQRLHRGESHLITEELAGILDSDPTSDAALEYVAAMLISGRHNELPHDVVRLPSLLCDSPSPDDDFPLTDSNPDPPSDH